MEYTDFYLNSSTGINTIRCRKLIPDGEIRGIVQIAHGIAEHIERYDMLMAYLASRGFAVCGNDHLGHGKSAQNENEKGFFSAENGWKHVTDDMLLLHDAMKAEFPSVPYILFGHSMGSFLTRTLIIDHPDVCDLVILSGTGHQNSLLITAGCLLSDLECRLSGAEGNGKKLESVAFGSYCKRIENPRTPHDWLSRDEKTVDAFLADPLCGFTCKNGLYRDMMHGIKYITDRNNISRMNKDCPVYFMSGDADPVGDYGEGVKKAYRAFCKAGLRDVTIRLYPGGRHEMLNELNRTDVLGDISDWIEEKLSSCRIATA